MVRNGVGTYLRIYITYNWNEDLRSTFQFYKATFSKILRHGELTNIFFGSSSGVLQGEDWSVKLSRISNKTTKNDVATIMLNQNIKTRCTVIFYAIHYLN